MWSVGWFFWFELLTIWTEICVQHPSSYHHPIISLLPWFLVFGWTSLSLVPSFCFPSNLIYSSIHLIIMINTNNPHHPHPTPPSSRPTSYSDSHPTNSSSTPPLILLHSKSSSLLQPAPQSIEPSLSGLTHVKEGLVSISYRSRLPSHTLTSWALN